jgi:hypothetical protein
MKILKIYTITSKQTSVKLGTNYPQVKGIQDYSKGDNHKYRVK